MKNLIKGFIAVSILFFASIQADDNSIVKIAKDAGNFSTLTQALQAADLVEILDEQGPFTVFAPTDKAFEQLPEGTLESLINDKEALKEILLYHVVKGSVTAEDIVKYEKAKSLSGSLINIKTSDSSVKLNDSNVISTDIKASNGIIHVIDRVLLPNSEG